MILSSSYFILWIYYDIYYNNYEELIFTCFKIALIKLQTKNNK